MAQPRNIRPGNSFNTSPETTPETEDGSNIISTSRARGGFKGRQALIMLVISLALAVGAYAILHHGFATTQTTPSH